METMETVETTVLVQKPRWFINRNFILLWIGRTISITGDFFFDTTMILWLTTGIARGQSWVPLAETIPTLVVGPIAGVFVDRWDKRRTMLIMDVLRAVLIALLLLTTGLVVLIGLHATFLDMTFTPVDTIFTGAGILVLCAGVYALVAMRGVKIEQQLAGDKA